MRIGPSQPSRSQRLVARRRGVTILETVLVVAAIVVITATALPAFQRSSTLAGEYASRHNLQILAAAQAMYAGDYQARQVTLMDERQNLVGGDCFSYLASFGCHPPTIFGRDADDVLFQFRYCTVAECGFFPNTWPNVFNTGSGAFRLGQTRPLSAYVNGRFWDEVFYAPNDAFTSFRASSKFGVESEYEDDPAVGEFLTSYCWSPAAMWNPAVFRKPSSGGFRAPETLANGFTQPRVTEALFPDLKTRMTEYWWCQDAPSPNQQAVAAELPYLFNGGVGSRPVTLFFDGSVHTVNTQAAVEDDAAVLESTGDIDGLWSRDTPYGTTGFFAGSMHDGSTPTSFHILTTEGIRGRDFLTVR